MIAVVFVVITHGLHPPLRKQEQPQQNARSLQETPSYTVLAGVT